MEPTRNILSDNQSLARRINEEARGDPRSPYAGKFIGLANGQVVVVADNWRDVSRRLRQIEPNPLNCFCLEASADYSAVHEIWSAI